MLLLLACTASKSELSETGVDSSLQAEEPITISFDAVIQQGGWGEALGRCDVQVVFLKQEQSDGMWEGPGQLWEPLNLPEADGECAVTLRDPEEMQELLDAQEAPEDNWVLEGQLDVGSVIRLESETKTVELVPEYDEENRLQHYALQDCSESSFPFFEVFDLVVPEDSDEFSAFRIEDALAIGPELRLTGLGSTVEIGSSTLYQTEDYPMAWEFKGDISELDIELEHSTFLTLRNNIEAGVQEFEGVVCMMDPEDGAMTSEFTLPADVLSQLTANTEAAPLYDIGLQLDSRVVGPEVEFPWGQRYRLQSTVSLDGKGELWED
jgi:hypothetical protein